MTHKFETLMAIHIRYDMANEDFYYADVLANRMRESIVSYIQSMPFDELRTTAEELTQPEVNPHKARVTYAGCQESVVSPASENRRSPNVFISGRLASIGAMVTEIASMGYRRLRKDSPLGQRAQHLNTASPNTIISSADEYITLPSVPMSTARMILRKAWNVQRAQESDRLRDFIQEATVEILDGIFEDGLPINSELTSAERRNINDGHDPF